MYTFYILFSKTLNKYYIGHTGDDVNDRLRRHMTDHSGFTSKAKDWMLIYTETFKEKTEAYKRELQVKCWKSSVRIRMLVHNTNH